MGCLPWPATGRRRPCPLASYMNPAPTPPSSSGSAYVWRVSVAVGITLLVLLLLTGLLGTAFGVFLRVLAALLIALPLRAGADWLHRRTGLPTGLALVAVTLLVAGGAGGRGLAVFGRASASRCGGCKQVLPQATRDVQARVRGTEWGQWLSRENIDFTRIMPGARRSGWAGPRASSPLPSACWLIRMSSFFWPFLSWHSAQALPGGAGDAGAQGAPRAGHAGARQNQRHAGEMGAGPAGVYAGGGRAHSAGPVGAGYADGGGAGAVRGAGNVHSQHRAHYFDGAGAAAGLLQRRPATWRSTCCCCTWAYKRWRAWP